MFKIHIFHHNESPKLNEIFEQLLSINQKTTKIMGIVEDLQLQVDGLKTQVADLQTAVDAEQQQIADLLAQNAAVVTSLNQQISDLQAQLAGAVSPAALQPIVDGLQEVANSIATTKGDIESTV